MSKGIGRTVKLTLVGAIVLAGWFVANNFGFFGFGKGSGSGKGEGATQSAPISEAALTVRVEGSRLLVDGLEMNVEGIADLAVKRNLPLVIERASDARIGPHDQLVEELRRRAIHYSIKNSNK